MNNRIRKTRYCIIACLVFPFFINSCKEREAVIRSVSVLWENGKATGIIIPKKYTATIPADSLDRFIRIRLSNSATPMLGTYNENDTAVVFRPLIAFTHGLKYEVLIKNIVNTAIQIPVLYKEIAPEVLAVYPAIDTLPENLLKLYILFSKPMQEGEALQHIFLVKSNTDTLPAVFLDLQPELWNKERTMLTLWLDPGRIKRDLIPNKSLGPPLTKNEHYQLIIRNDWQDASGTLLTRDFSKHFFTTIRDSLSPAINAWTIIAPAAASAEKLEVHFHETLDYILAANTIQIKTANGEIVKGIITVNNNASILNFTPTGLWKKGTYILEAEPILEDLAGNNLNRLFDTDLSKKRKEEQDVFRRNFSVQ